MSLDRLQAAFRDFENANILTFHLQGLENDPFALRNRLLQAFKAGYEDSKLHAAEAASASEHRCHVCGSPTSLCCSDCRINFDASVYVCSKAACRDAHDLKCYGDSPLKTSTSLAPGLLDGVRHDVDCAILHTPANYPHRRPCSCGAEGKAGRDPFADRYHELLLAVERKFPGESRHATALRYIREAEQRSASEAGAANKGHA